MSIHTELLNAEKESTSEIEHSVTRIHPRLMVTIFMVLLPIIYFYPAVKGEVVLMPGDGWLYSFLMRMLGGQMISAGVLPLSNPYTFAGWPFLATIQPGLLYPPNWLFAILPPATAMNIVVITTYHISLIGVYRYARCLELDRLSSLIAASAFSFGGFMISHI